MAHKLNDIKIDETKLLKKGYRVADLVDKKFVVSDVTKVDGDNGTYLICSIEGAGLEPGRKLTTGSQNVVERLLAASAQQMLPLEVTVRRLGGNAFDIE